MFEVFKYVDKFFTSLTNYLTYNDIFIIFAGLFLLTTVVVIFSTSKAYEAKLIKAIDKFNAYFIDNPQINEENLVAFNLKMKARFVPKQLRKCWQQFVLYREHKASVYMSFENCVATPIKNSSYKRDTKIMNILSYIFSFCALILNCYYCYETADLASVLSSVLLTPALILLFNYIFQIFFHVKHSAIISDLFQNYQYFEVNIDKATETLPDYVDYEVLFDRNEIKKGIPILYAYLQKRAEEEQRELERARLKNVEHEKFNFDDAGVEASLVLERAMQEAENYIAERKKYIQDTEQINADMTQEDMNYREITKEYNRQMQVSRETFANFKAQLEEASSSIEANYLKKQQQQELDRQRNLERDFDTATERHKKVIEGFHAELDTVDKFISQSRKTLETAMKSEFSTYSGKVYDEVRKAVEQREKEKVDKLKEKIEELEEFIVVKNKELDDVYGKNQLLSEELEKFNVTYSAPVQEQYPVEETAVTQEEHFEPDQEKEYLETEQAEEYIEPEEMFEQEEAVEDIPEEVFEEENNEESNQEFESEEIKKTDENQEISANEENDSIEEKVVSRRGRPKKVVEATKQEEKRGRGRPRKEVQEEQVSPVKKGRGRPKKQVEETVSTENVEPKKGRGRPRKEVQEEQVSPVKKGRGRPKKQVEETVSTENVEPKKGRGRPRKEVQEEQVSPVKKGRGRPKKQVEETVSTENVEPKKGRGRPRKEVQEEQVSPVKKGRGRPKKQINLNQDLDVVAENIEDIDEYLKQIDNAIAEENAKLEETQKELSKNARLRRKK